MHACGENGTDLFLAFLRRPYPDVAGALCCLHAGPVEMSTIVREFDPSRAW